VRGMGVALMARTSIARLSCLTSPCGGPKTLFLIDYQETEVLELDVLREQAMCADEISICPLPCARELPSALSGCESARSFHIDWNAKALLECLVVLESEDVVG